MPDVRIVVETEDGDAGRRGHDRAPTAHYLIPIDEPGTYVVRLDQDSLPEGLSVAEGKDSFTVTLTANNTQTRGSSWARTSASPRAGGANCPRSWRTV